jgi:hypothetical protein
MMERIRVKRCDLGVDRVEPGEQHRANALGAARRVPRGSGFGELDEREAESARFVRIAACRG